MRVREVSSLGAHKREETSRSMHRSRKERIKTNLPFDASLRTLNNRSSPRNHARSGGLLPFDAPLPKRAHQDRWTSIN
jgi:hypothetical protein